VAALHRDDLARRDGGPREEALPWIGLGRTSVLGERYVRSAMDGERPDEGVGLVGVISQGRSLLRSIHTKRSVRETNMRTSPRRVVHR